LPSKPESKLLTYAAAGPELSWYQTDVAQAALTKRGAVRLPANVQYAWPHASRRHLYVVSSDSASGVGGFVGTKHHASAFRIDAATGALAAHGAVVPLPSRPIHVTTDIASRFLLTAYNNPSRITVHRINEDATLAEELEQKGAIDAGVFAHQVRVSPSNRLAILVARGNNAAAGKPEDPGALKVYDFDRGMLTRTVTIAPKGGMGFGPRHLDFHPSQPWCYVSLERQNQLAMFRMKGDALEPEPTFVKDLLARPDNVRVRQLGGTVHVHPNGRYVYGCNRADSEAGENSIVVFALDARTGEPKLIQHADTGGLHPRTFHIEPGGRMMIVAHIAPGGLAVFRIAEDGKLQFVRNYEVDGPGLLWWMGMVNVPAFA
jgi:6-phosphogluconolactonase (cycloisomerase 2 family)